MRRFILALFIALLFGAYLAPTGAALAVSVPGGCTTGGAPNPDNVGPPTGR